MRRGNRRGSGYAPPGLAAPPRVSPWVERSAARGAEKPLAKITGAAPERYATDAELWRRGAKRPAPRPGTVIACDRKIRAFRPVRGYGKP